MFATGKYQTIFSTLRAARDALKLTGNELYDASLQERVLREFLIPTAGQGVLYRFLTAKVGSVNDAQLATAKQWASIGVPPGMSNKYGKLSNGVLSYYDETGVNVADEEATQKLRAFLIHLSGPANENG